MLPPMTDADLALVSLAMSATVCTFARIGWRLGRLIFGGGKT